MCTLCQSLHIGVLSSQTFTGFKVFDYAYVFFFGRNCIMEQQSEDSLSGNFFHSTKEAS